MNQIKLAFNMIWLMEVLKIQQKEQLLIKFKETKVFHIAKSPKFCRYQRGFASAVYKFSDKKSPGGVAMLRNE